MIRWFAKNDIATNLIMIGILFAGFFIALPSMPVEVNPTYPYRVVIVDFKPRGVTTEDLERLIVIPAENALENVSGIRKVSSDTSYGYARIRVYAKDTADLATLKAEVESSISTISSIPADTDKPRIFIPDPNRWHEVISIMVSGDLTPRQLEAAGKQVRDDLLATPGISAVQLQGKNRRYIYIEPDIDALRTHQLTLSDISKAVRDSSVDLTAGRISTESQGIQVTAKNQATNKEEFEKIIIKTVKGAELRIGDIAAVKDSSDADDKKIFLFNGAPCMRVEVLRLKNESALKVAELVHEYVEKQQGRFPEGVELSIWDDESIALRSRISILKENLTQGAVLVIIVLTLFLRPSLAIFVVMGVPISFAGGLILMHLMGVSINMWTLFGFIIVLGIVVDDAIVTAENIHSKLLHCNNRLDAVVLGTKEVATPVTFGVITTIVAFIPLLFFGGQFGNIAKQIPFVIIPVLLFSLIESKFILPGHLKHNYDFLRPINPFPVIHRNVDKFLSFVVTTIYQPVLRFCISYRHAVVLCFAAILIATISYMTGPRLKLETIPEVERYIIAAEVELPPEASLEETHSKILQLYESLEQLSEEFMDGDTGKSLIGDVFTTSGGRSWGAVDPNFGIIYVEVTPPRMRDPDTKQEDMVTNSQIAVRWQELVGDIPGVNRFNIKSSQYRSRAFAKNSPIEFEIRGDNEENKRQVADAFDAWADTQQWVSYAHFGKGNKTRQLNFKVNSNGIDQGLTDASLARQVRSQLLGETAQKFQLNDDEIRVNVRLPDEQRENPHALNLIRIKTRQGETSLKSVANFEETFGEPTIERNAGSRILTMKVGAVAAEKGRQNQHLEAINKKMNELCEDFSGVSWGYVGQVASDIETRERFVIGMAALTFVLFSLLAIPFKSIVQPLFVILAVPLGVVGALLGHYHMGVNVSYLSLIGILALSGVVVNDSLVIVDFINRRRKEGRDVKRAIIDSGLKRFRPIMLTSITTFAGLYPIMHEASIEATFLKPMAISLGFGILYATLITLILIPCTYMVGEDLKNYLRWFFTGKKNNRSPVRETTKRIENPTV